MKKKLFNRDHFVQVHFYFYTYVCFLVIYPKPIIILYNLNNIAKKILFSTSVIKNRIGNISFYFQITTSILSFVFPLTIVIYTSVKSAI